MTEDGRSGSCDQGANALGDCWRDERQWLLVIDKMICSPPAEQVAIYKSLHFEVAGSGPLKAPPPYPGNMEMFVFVKHTEKDTY